MSFDIKPKNDNKSNAILFQSTYGAITLNTQGSGKLGFSRDGYAYTFNFIPENTSWQTLRLVGDYKSVTLFVDGKEKEHLMAYKKTEGLPNGFSYQQTLVFPLEKIGDTKRIFWRAQKLKIDQYRSSKTQITENTFLYI